MLIDVIDPLSEKKLFTTEREVVHRDGGWHMAIQANIIRERNSVLEILVQKRSDKVDIAKNCVDQSMAVQMIHGENLIEEALVRGLGEELGLSDGDYEYVQFNKEGKFRIKKRYAYDSNLKNNEVLKLFIVVLKKDAVVNSPKVSSIYWLPWNEFVDLTKKANSTKTVRMYTWESKIKDPLETAMWSFLNNRTIDDVRINVELETDINTKFKYD